MELTVRNMKARAPEEDLSARHRSKGPSRQLRSELGKERFKVYKGKLSVYGEREKEQSRSGSVTSTTQQ